MDETSVQAAICCSLQKESSVTASLLNNISEQYLEGATKSV